MATLAVCRTPPCRTATHLHPHCKNRLSSTAIPVQPNSPRHSSTVIPAQYRKTPYPSAMSPLNTDTPVDRPNRFLSTVPPNRSLSTDIPANKKNVEIRYHEEHTPFIRPYAFLPLSEKFGIQEQAAGRQFRGFKNGKYRVSTHHSSLGSYNGL